MEKTPRAPKLKVPITKEQINESIARDSSHCMIADAIRAHVPDAKHISVDLQTIRFSDPKKGLRYTYLTPRIGQVALVNFDQGIKPDPFELPLRGAQVTYSGSRQKRSAKSEVSPAQHRQRMEASEKSRKVREKLKKARLVDRNASGDVPEVVGGKTPPKIPGGNRREFGLRGLVR